MFFFVLVVGTRLHYRYKSLSHGNYGEYNYDIGDELGGGQPTGFYSRGDLWSRQDYLLSVG
jgi:hypothetical protein